MTREEAVELLSNDAFKLCMVQLRDPLFEDCYEALCMAIKALQQETVSRETYDHEFNLRKEFEMKVFELEKKIIEQESKRGKLIAIDDTHDQCMECGAIFCITSSDEWEVNYCPNCGKGMESDIDGSD